MANATLRLAKLQCRAPMQFNKQTVKCFASWRMVKRVGNKRAVKCINGHVCTGRFAELQ